MKQLSSPLCVFAFLTCALPLASAQVYERIDVNSLGQPATTGARYGGEMSHSGRIVVFVSEATNLGGPDVSGTRDVFVRDRQLATTTRLTPPSSPGNTVQHGTARVSGDGSTVVFTGATATGELHAFEYVVATGTTIELFFPGLLSPGFESLNLDGRFAAITAQTATNPTRQVYRYDLATQALVLCSRTAGGDPAGGRNADIDDDGTHVAFESTSSVIVVPDANGSSSDIFVFDIPSALMERANVATNGTQANGQAFFPRITGSGRYVSMTSTATNLVPGDSPNNDIFVRDLRLGTTVLSSRTNQQTPIPIGADEAPSFLSEDATSVAFSSLHLTGPGDAPITLDVFVRDDQMGVLLPASPGNSTNGVDTFASGITNDGRQVLMFSYSQTLVNGIGPGYFMADFGPRCSTSGYCTSLANSTGRAASIGAQGDASFTLNNLVISGVGLPGNANALLVSGSAAVDPGAPFGNGLLCIGGGMIRHGVFVANGGAIIAAQNLSLPEYAGVNPGDTRYYQIFYRDPPAGGALFNTTDGVAVTFCW